MLSLPLGMVGTKIGHHSLFAATAAMVVVFALVSFPLEAGAAKRKPILRPTWAESPAACTPNNSFFVDLQSNLEEDRRRQMIEALVDKNRAAELRRQYEARHREYERRKNYDLLPPELEQQHFSSMSSFSSEIMGEIQKYHTERQTQKLEKLAMSDPVIFAVANGPLGYAAGGVLYTMGKEYSFRVVGESRLHLIADVPEQRAKVELKSSYVDTSLNVVGPKPLVWMRVPEPMQIGFLRPRNEERNETYVASVGRRWHFLGMSTGMSFLGTSKTLRASLTKDLTSQLSCTLSNAKLVSFNSRTLTHREHAVQLEYKVDLP